MYSKELSKLFAKFFHGHLQASMKSLVCCPLPRGSILPLSAAEGVTLASIARLQRTFINYCARTFEDGQARMLAVIQMPGAPSQVVSWGDIDVLVDRITSDSVTPASKSLSSGMEELVSEWCSQALSDLMKDAVSQGLHGLPSDVLSMDLVSESVCCLCPDENRLLAGLLLTCRPISPMSLA